MNDVISLLLSHVSVRKYEEKNITREFKDLIIKCAQMAPTSSHFQLYSIIEIVDKNKREILADIAGGQEWLIKAPLVLLFCGDLYRGQKYFEDINKEVLSNTEFYTTAAVDTALAAQKALIAAQSLGLGGVFVGGIRNDVEKVAKEFRLPKMVFPLFALCIGYPKDIPDLKPRLPKEVVHKIDFYDVSKDDELIEQYNQTVKEYYAKRTHGKIQDRWTQRCGRALMDKTRDDVGYFLRKIGLLER